MFERFADGFRRSFWLIIRSVLPWSLAALTMRWPSGNQHVQSQSTGKVLKSIPSSMANRNQNICWIAEPFHSQTWPWKTIVLNRQIIYPQMEDVPMPCLFARGQPSILLVTHPVWLQMGHCQAMFVGEGDWFFAFNSQDAGVYSRFADINVPAIYVCVCVCCA